MRLISGLQPVREAIRAHGARIERVLVEKSDSPQLNAVARFAEDQGAKVERVSRAELDKMAKGARHQGALALAPELSLVNLEDAAFADDALIIALDELEDPQNFGAIIRSSVAMGANTILWPEHHSAPLSPATFRASAGAIEHATLIRVSQLPNALTHLKSIGFAIVGLEMNGDQSIQDVELRGKTVIVIGAEGKGLRKTVKRECTTLARLPMSGKLQSLNASVAAGIALYETLRQRSVPEA